MAVKKSDTKAKAQTVTKGRVVFLCEHYIEPGTGAVTTNDDGEPDTTHDEPELDGYTALVTDVNDDDTIDLVVFYPGLAGIAVRNVPEGDDDTAGSWYWPPRD